MRKQKPPEVVAMIRAWYTQEHVTDVWVLVSVSSMHYSNLILYQEMNINRGQRSAYIKTWNYVFYSTMLAYVDHNQWIHDIVFYVIAKV